MKIKFQYTFQIISKNSFVRCSPTQQVVPAHRPAPQPSRGARAVSVLASRQRFRRASCKHVPTDITKISYDGPCCRKENRRRWSGRQRFQRLSNLATPAPSPIVLDDSRINYSTFCSNQRSAIMCYKVSHSHNIESECVINYYF